jgi:hypothetical protein
VACDLVGGTIRVVGGARWLIEFVRDPDDPPPASSASANSATRAVASPMIKARQR